MANPTYTDSDLFGDDAPDDAATLLGAAWGEGPHSLCWRKSDGGFAHTFVSSPAELLMAAKGLKGTDVWWGIHPLTDVPASGRGSATDVAMVSTLAADLDWAHPTRRTTEALPTEAEVRSRLASLGSELAPSAVVNTGHGLQPYWFMRGPVTPDAAEVLTAGLDAALEAVDLVNGRSDLASILRVPGTVNHKGEPVAVVVESIDTDRAFTPEYLRKRLPAAAPRTGRGHTRHHGGAVTEGQQALCDFVVVRHGGHSVDVWRDGSMHVVRPGKDATLGSSASIIIGDEGDPLLTVWSDHWDGLVKGSYVLGVDGKLHHPGDPLAAIKVIEGGKGKAQGADVSQDDEPLRTGPNLPLSFWNARPLLASIREYAHSRALSADSVYAAIRARFNTLVPYSLRVDTGVATAISLNALVGIVANSGGGKSTSMELAEELVPLDQRVDVYEVPPGSGEGMVESFFEFQDVTDPETGKTKKAKVKTRDAVLMSLDEGEGLVAVAQRNGATFTSQLRSAYSGKLLGQANATLETNRRLDAHSYRLTLLVGFQPEISARLLSEASLGTPQRFVLFNATDPSITRKATTTIPVLPDPLPTITGTTHRMTLTPAVEKEVADRYLARTRGELRVPLLDSHRDQNRIKEAAVLALLDGRMKINPLDWKLAGLIMDTSDALRTWAAEVKREADRETTRARGVEEGERGEAAAGAKAHYVHVMAEKIVAVLSPLGAEGLSVGKLARVVSSSATRHRFQPALDMAVADGLVTVEGLRAYIVEGGL